jgi:hypothetical protein
MVRKRKSGDEVKIERPKRAKLSAKESLKRMQDFAKRKGAFIATIREDKNRGVSA